MRNELLVNSFLLTRLNCQLYSEETIYNPLVKPSVHYTFIIPYFLFKF